VDADDDDELAAVAAAQLHVALLDLCSWTDEVGKIVQEYS